MRRDGVAVGEGVEPGRERAAIGQGNAAVLDLPDLDTLAVDELLAVVGLQQQPVTSGHFQLAGLAHVKGGGGTGRNEIHFRAIGTADAQTVFQPVATTSTVSPRSNFLVCRTKRRRWPGSNWLAFFFWASVHESESNTVTGSSCWPITPSAFSASRTLSVTASISDHVGETSSADLPCFVADKYASAARW